MRATVLGWRTRMRARFSNKTLIDGRRRAGACVVKTLSLIAAQSAKPDRLVRRLHTLSDDSKIESMCHTHHGRDDRGRFRVASKTIHERLVDLELVERKTLEVCER